jgi:unsaturated chondroitin disaccharide hydrolase
MNQVSHSHPAPASAGNTPAEFTQAYAVCVEKIRRNIVTLADQPKTGAFAKDGNYFNFPEGFFEIGNWTSSFFTGMALLAHDSTGDSHFLTQTQRLAGAYRDKVFTHPMETMHDLGFLYSLYSIPLYQRTHEAAHKRTALKAADELAKRYIPAGRYIRAWGRMDESDTDYAGLAIIDCMMNLPLLFWAARETGDQRYHEIAVAHANTTQAIFVRNDDSVFHAYRFDATGAPAGGANYCGHTVDSHWARGTGWAIYGFALAYRYTKDVRYLDTARRVARKFISLLDQEVVPVWDFRLSKDSPPLRDSSAAAVAACGLYELASHHPEETAWATAGDTLLKKLCTPKYLDERPECHGVLKDAQVGDGFIAGTSSYQAKNVYTSWGDYFFMEALGRRVHGNVSYW